MKKPSPPSAADQRLGPQSYLMGLRALAVLAQEKQ
jgi:hypothetical protein